MIDLHSHILPGLDDGARTVEDSVAIARASVAAGVEAIAATPHVRADYPTAAEAMRGGVAAVREALARSGIELELLPGAELDLEHTAGLGDAELAAYGLGGNPRLLLVEFPYVGWPAGLATRLAELRRRGFTIVLAHPERSDEVQAAPARLAPLVEAGTLVQLTAASVVGRLGTRARAAAHDLLDLELAHLVAGDVHSAGSSVSTEQLAGSLGSSLARWLAADVPAALLRSEPPPERPPRPARRRRALWRLRR